MNTAYVKQPSLRRQNQSCLDFCGFRKLFHDDIWCDTFVVIWIQVFSEIREKVRCPCSASCEQDIPLPRRVANCFEFKVAHYLAKKRTKRSTSFFNPKSAIILTPQTIFIAFLCINFFQMVNLSIFSCFFWFFLRSFVNFTLK